MARRGRIQSVVAAIPGAVIAVAACGQGTSSRADATFAVDSAGIEIVTSDPLTAGARCFLGDEPILSLGELDGEDAYLFHQIRDAARLSDGNVFSRTGEFSRAVQPVPYQLHAFVRGGVLRNGTSINVTQAMAAPGT